MTEKIMEEIEEIAERKVFVACNENDEVIGYFPSWIPYKNIPENGVFISEEEWKNIKNKSGKILKNSKLEIAPEKEKTYAQKRAEEYPPIQEQLDIIYHQGLEGWKASIKVIKDKYPKDAG